MIQLPTIVTLVQLRHLIFFKIGHVIYIYIIHFPYHKSLSLLFTPWSTPCRCCRLLLVFSNERELLESRGRLMIRQLCGHLDPRRLYVTVARAIQQEGTAVVAAVAAVAARERHGGETVLQGDLPS